MGAIFPENMKILILLSSIALVSATQVNTPPRSVNVALETSFVFDPKDLKDNKSFVNHIRRFLDKLYSVLEPETSEKRFRTDTKPEVEEGSLGPFIEIMQGIGQNFMNMTAPKIKEALDTIHIEVKNVTKKHQSVLSQVLPNETQNLVKDLIDTWLRSSPEDIKIFLNSTLTENKPLLKIVARRVNSYYNAEDVKQLNKILKKFKRYIATNKDTTIIVKKLLHNTIFKKYDHLNESARAAVMGDLSMLSEFLIAKNSKAAPDTQRNSPSQEVDKPANPDDFTYTALRRSIQEKIKNVREKNENKKKGTNDVIVGNLELFVKPAQKS